MNRLERYLKERREMRWYQRHRVVLIVLALALCWTVYRDRSGAAAVRESSWDILRSWANEDATEAQLDALFEACHHDALETAYDERGRRSMLFVEDLYAAELFDCMEQRARSEGDAQLAIAVTRIYHDLQAQRADYDGAPVFTRARTSPGGEHSAASPNSAPSKR